MEKYILAMSEKGIIVSFQAETIVPVFDYATLKDCIQTAWTHFGDQCRTKGYLTDIECPINPRHLYQYYENIIKVILYFYCNNRTPIDTPYIRTHSQLGVTVNIFSGILQEKNKMLLRLGISFESLFSRVLSTVSLSGSAFSVSNTHKDLVEYQTGVTFDSPMGVYYRPKSFPGAVMKNGFLDLSGINLDPYFTLDKCPEYLNERGLSGYAREKLLQPGSYQQYVESLKDYF